MSITASSRKLAIFVLLVAVFLSQFHDVHIGAGTLDPNRLRLIDQVCELDENHQVTNPGSSVRKNSSRLLVRGNLPFNSNGHLDAQLLIRAIQDELLTAGDDVPINNKNEATYTRKLVIVSLLASTQKDEVQALEQERNSILAAAVINREKSLEVELIHIPIAGSLWSMLPGPVAKWLPNHRLFDTTGGAWDLSEQLHSMLHRRQQEIKKNHQEIIYVHCMRGIDRTGLLAGTYAMRYQGASLESVQRTNQQIGKRRLQFLEESSLRAASEKAKQRS